MTSAAALPDPDDPSFVYDELALYRDNAEEVGLPFTGTPPVRRTSVEVRPGQSVSALVWGDGAEVVFVHGGSQNAHTWDTTLLALGASATCVDLPGHGHSSWKEDQAYEPAAMADDIAVAIRALAPSARMVVGMSLGGLTSLALAQRHPDLVRRLVLVDVTPGVNGDKAKAIIDFISGPQSFTKFGDLLARTIEHNPTRTVTSLRRGILHNAHRNDDGTWSWNYDRRTPHGGRADLASLWDAIGNLHCPLTLLRGSTSPVVDDADVAEVQRRRPDAKVVLVEGAGHSIQGDKPLELAEILRAELSAG